MQRKPLLQANAEGTVLTKATVRAADGLGLTARILSAVIGVSVKKPSQLSPRSLKAGFDHSAGRSSTSRARAAPTQTGRRSSGRAMSENSAMAWRMPK